MARQSLQGRAESLTHRERVQLAVEHRETDRVPIAMVCSGINAPARRELEAYLNRERGTSVDAYIEPLLDIRTVGPRYIGPPLRDGEDFWGVVREPISYGDDSYSEIRVHPLADARSVGDLNDYPWPRIEWFDFDAMDDEIRRVSREGDYCLMVGAGNPFESSWYMRGFERMFEDMALDIEFVQALLDRVTRFFIEFTRRQLETARGRVDLAFTADDIAGQQGLLCSLKLWERTIKPCHVALNRCIHEFGVKAIYHSDGAVMNAVPGLLDMGIDVLQALQFDAAGMDPVRLKSEFGDRLCFEGGVSVQRTLPFGSAEEVRREVEERIRVLGRSGGYILGPSHAIQAGTPPENIVALFDTAARTSPHATG